MDSAQRYSPLSQFVSQEATARDEELLLAARAGSHAAFSELRNIYAHRLYKRILSMTRNREDAEDALQDTFFSAYLALPSFEGRSRVSSWLTRIAINSALMILRKRRSRLETSAERHSDAEDDRTSFQVRDHALSPEQLCDLHERREAVLRAIQRLDPKLRSVMNIWISQGTSTQEIAHDLGISSASVKARLHRARRRLIRSPAFRDHRARLSPSNQRALIGRRDVQG